MSTFYHVAPLLLEVGSVILPGNWGRVLRAYRNANDILYRETVLEQVRLTEFPAKPSRLQAIFLLETLAEAQFFRANLASTNLIYEVEVQIDDRPTHRGNYNKVGAVNQPILDLMPKIAREYWSLEPTERVEVVVDASARVLACHE